MRWRHAICNRTIELKRNNFSFFLKALQGGIAVASVPEGGGFSEHGHGHTCILRVRMGMCMVAWVYGSYVHP
jgi:hypothetical protein